MAENVGTIEYSARINTSQLKKDAAETDKVAKQTGSSLDKGLGDGAKKAGIAIAAVGAGLTVVAKQATDFTVDYVRSSTKLAREIGGTTEESSRLLFVIGRLGIEAGTARSAFGLFSKNIVESGQAGNETTGTLNKLGVAVKNADGSARSFNDILLDTADKFKTLPAGAERTALAMELFGKFGKDLIPLLNLGSQGIKDLETRADELGLTLNTKTIGAVSRYIESQKQLKESTDAMKIAIGTATAPVLTEFNNKLNEVILKLIQTDSPFKGLLTNILAFGGPVLAAAGGMLAFAANATTAIQGVASVYRAAAASSAASWIGAQVAMVGSAIATAASHVISAAIAGGAWVKNAALASAAWISRLGAVRAAGAATAAFLAVPMVMPALVIAAALASIGMVYQAVIAVKGALDALNNSARASESAARSAMDVNNKLRQLERTGTPDQRLRASNTLRQLGDGGFASGGFTGRGGTNQIAGLVHKGEYVLPKSAVDQLTGMPKLSLADSDVTTQSGNTFIINLSGVMTRSKADERDVARSLVRSLNDELSAKNLDLIGGGAI